MKNLVHKMLPLLFTPFLVCCSTSLSISDNTISIGSIRNTKSTEIYFSAAQCKGDITYQITVSEKHSLNIATKVAIEDGSFTILVTDKTDEAVFEETLAENKDFDIALKEFGKYKIKVSSDYFKGSYRFDWAKK